MGERLAIYVVAHPDDWFYFMASCVKDAHEASSFIIILLTAGDSGKDIWARELALRHTAINLLLINDGYEGPLESFSEEAHDVGPDGYSSFTIASPKMTVRLYTFRLPDGNINGDGFDKTGHQSLHKCLLNGTPIRQLKLRPEMIIAEDEFGNYSRENDDVFDVVERRGSSQRGLAPKRKDSRGRKNFTTRTFTSDGLASVIQKIILKEANMLDITSEKVIESLTINSTHPERGEHSDHRVAGHLSVKVAQKLNCNIALWADYSDSGHEANQDAYSIVCKGLLLGAYTSTIHRLNPLAFGSDGTPSWKWLCYNEVLYQGKGKDFQLIDQ